MSTTIDEARKKEISSVLRADFMSSEDSEYEDVTTPRDGDSSGSELEDTMSSKKKKRLVKHKPRWRCREMQSVVESLDMKIGHCRDVKAKKMCLEVIEGEDSTRSKLDGLPEWAAELFN